MNRWGARSRSGGRYIKVLVLFFLLAAPVRGALGQENSAAGDPDFQIAGQRENPGSSVFPLLKHLVPKDQWHRRPRPYGLSYTYHTQNQWMRLAKVVLWESLDVPPTILENVIANSITYSHSIRADFWLLPFLNLFALASYTTGSANLYITADSLPQPLTPVFDVTAYSIGPGFTLALGFDNIFFTATGTYVFVFRPSSDSSQNSAITLNLGYSFPVFTVWLGAMWQQTGRSQSGTIGGLRYDIELELENPWNMTAGFRFILVEQRLELVYQQGFGDRSSSTMNLIWRYGQ